ncbi:hypothetical protein GTS_30820 [Gandjariella thermophila]|uniref:Uncharacterized protein n=1 Tax=Gandjariella thermophila TaxID=1931992 RepID=A0A4D4JAM0_9PSEU|nr:hypothetical protein GTS_30820 [Gandjariella thermophila]
MAARRPLPPWRESALKFVRSGLCRRARRHEGSNAGIARPRKEVTRAHLVRPGDAITAARELAERKAL